MENGRTDDRDPHAHGNEPGLGIPFPIIGTVAIYISCIISVYSATEYSYQLIKKMRELRKAKKKLEGK